MSLLTVESAQLPRVDVRPASVSSDAATAGFLSASYGLTPDPWQQMVLDGWLGRREDGRWSALTCGLSIPRQNGKNGVIEMRVLYGMVALGEKWLHTAHQVKTARKAFVRLASFFQNKRMYPELAEVVQAIRQANGQEAIYLTNGGSCEFIARSKNSGRGFTVDGLVCDEAQEMSDEDNEALIPTTSAAPLSNPQWIFTGTPPSVGVNGEVFTKVRADALEQNDPRLCWQEWSADSVGSVNDRQAWFDVNPALLTGRLQMDVVEGERQRFTDEGFARERLGVWLDSDANAPITAEKWARLADPESRRAGLKVVFAVEAETDRSSAVISVACANEAGRTHVELTHPGQEMTIPQAGERLIEMAKARNADVFISAASPAASLVPVLRARNVTVVVVPAPGVRSGSGALLDAVEEGSVAHTGRQFTLTRSVVAGRKNQTALGWTWREDPGSAPLRSVSLAHFGWQGKRKGSQGRVVVLSD
jgi:hypothetical protein